MLAGKCFERLVSRSATDQSAGQCPGSAVSSGGALTGRPVSGTDHGRPSPASPGSYCAHRNRVVFGPGGMGPRDRVIRTKAVGRPSRRFCAIFAPVDAPRTAIGAPPTSARALPTAIGALPTGARAPPMAFGAPPTAVRALPTRVRALPMAVRALQTARKLPTTGAWATPVHKNGPCFTAYPSRNK